MDASEILTAYERDGFVIVRNVLDQELIEEAKAHVEWLLEQNPDVPPEGLDTFLVGDDPFWLRLVGDDRLLDCIEPIYGSNIALFASHYIAKPPKTGKAVGWHQDGSYWPLEPMEVATAWLALDKADAENGCMRVLPGTHQERLRGYEEMHEAKDTVLGNTLDISKFDESSCIDIELEPGDISLHHPNLVHGSNANASDRWRRGLTIRYIPTTTKVTNPDHVGPWLLRGSSEGGPNQFALHPEYDSSRHFNHRR